MSYYSDEEANKTAFSRVKFSPASPAGQTVGTVSVLFDRTCCKVAPNLDCRDL